VNDAWERSEDIKSKKRDSMKHIEVIKKRRDTQKQKKENEE
jgi:hypothetical protein